MAVRPCCRLLFVLWAAIGIALVSCQDRQETALPNEDGNTWLTTGFPTPDKLLRWQYIKDQFVLDVRKDRIPQATARLAEVSFLELEQAEAQEYAGVTLPQDPGRFYLVRSVRNKGGRGQVDVYRNEDVLGLVCIVRSRELRLLKRPVIILLGNPPATILVGMYRGRVIGRE